MLDPHTPTFEADVALYLKSAARIARLEKRMTFAAMIPRVGEFVKVTNRELGDYFAYSVVQVTHREGQLPDLWIKLTEVISGQSTESLLPDEEIDGAITSYQREGWRLGSCKDRKSR